MRLIPVPTGNAMETVIDQQLPTVDPRAYGERYPELFGEPTKLG